MQPLVVIVVDPIGDLIVYVVKRNEIMLPRTFFLKAPEKPLNHAVLFWRIKRYVLLLVSIFSHCLVKPLRAKHKPIVGSNHKAMNIRNDLLPDQCILKHTNGDYCITGSGEPPDVVADPKSVETVDYCHQMAPAFLFREKMRNVDLLAAVG